jgi:hypothetical protein
MWKTDFERAGNPRWETREGDSLIDRYANAAKECTDFPKI